MQNCYFYPVNFNFPEGYQFSYEIFTTGNQAQTMEVVQNKNEDSFGGNSSLIRKFVESVVLYFASTKESFIKDK
jgi:hypothetical protein